jgi:hypothetical protein
MLSFIGGHVPHMTAGPGASFVLSYPTWPCHLLKAVLVIQEKSCQTKRIKKNRNILQLFPQMGDVFKIDSYYRLYKIFWWCVYNL